jgi:hypothetical protein
VNINVKDTAREARQSQATRDGREVVYETQEERQERLRLEKFADLIKQCLNEVLDEREQTKEEAAKKKRVSLF